MADTCTICRGIGKVEVEDASGNTIDYEPCPYCEGERTLAWVVRRRASLYIRYRWREALSSAVMWGTVWLMWHNRHWTWWWADPSQDSLPIGQQAPFPWHHVVFWACWLAILLAWGVKRALWPAPTPVADKVRKAGGTGFTTNRERASLAALAAGLFIKREWDHRHDRR